MAEQAFKDFFSQSNFFQKFKIVFLFLCGFAIFATSISSIFWIIKMRKASSLTERVLEQSRQLASVAPSYSFAYEIKDMSIPLTNYKHTRSAFAQFTLILDCPTEAAKKRMTTLLPKLLDTILVVGSNFYVEDFEAPLAEKGFARFKNELKIAYSKFLSEDSPREVVIKDWFMN